MIEIEPLSLSVISRGLCEPDIAAAWQRWRTMGLSGRFLYDTEKPFRRRLTLSSSVAEVDRAPALITVGPDSFCATCYGPDWTARAPLVQHVPDDDLERIAAAGYRAAIEGEPNLDVVHAVTADQAGRRMDIIYERLVVPVTTAGGHRVIVCMTAALRGIRWMPWPDAAGRTCGSSRDSRRHEYVQAPEASAFRQEIYGHSPDGRQSLWQPAGLR